MRYVEKEREKQRKFAEEAELEKSQLKDLSQ